MALAGALKLVPDEPGVVVVVIFPDNVFKYASSITKHVPGMGVKAPTSLREELAGHMIENVRGNDALTIDQDEAKVMMSTQEPFIVDVRGYETYAKAHIPGAVSMPLKELPNLTGVLPDDRNAPILCVCQKGNASLSGALFMLSLGYKKVRSLNGGTLAWIDSGNDVEND